MLYLSVYSILGNLSRKICFTIWIHTSQFFSPSGPVLSFIKGVGGLLSLIVGTLQIQCDSTATRMTINAMRSPWQSYFYL